MRMTRHKKKKTGAVIGSLGCSAKFPSSIISTITHFIDERTRNRQRKKRAAKLKQKMEI